MKIKEIAFSSYTIDDTAKARNFYEKILGLVPASIFEQGEMLFIEYQIGEHTLCIGKGAPNFKAGKDGGVTALEVDDFNELIDILKKNNVPFVMDAQDTGVCHMALVEDPSGNRIMIHKRK